jgi:hypothetical protein
LAFSPPKVMKNAAWISRLPTELSSRPKRTRISYRAELETTTDVALRKESRTRFINATTLNRNSGERRGGTCCALSRHPLLGEKLI